MTVTQNYRNVSQMCNCSFVDREIDQRAQWHCSAKDVRITNVWIIKENLLTF